MACASARSSPTSCRSTTDERDAYRRLRIARPPSRRGIEAGAHRCRIAQPCRTSVPVVVDEDKCIAHKGCTVCVDVCPLDVLAIDRAEGQGLHEVRRVLVLHALRGRLPDRRGHGQHSLPAALRGAHGGVRRSRFRPGRHRRALRGRRCRACAAWRCSSSPMSWKRAPRRCSSPGCATRMPPCARRPPRRSMSTTVSRSWRRWCLRSRTRSRPCAPRPPKRWLRRRCRGSAPLLIDRAAHSDPFVRAAALRALRELVAPEAMPAGVARAQGRLDPRSGARRSPCSDISSPTERCRR